MDILNLRARLDRAQNSGRISGHNYIRWNISGDNAAGANDCVLADAQIAENR
jgi:hypothetical protein